MTLRNMTSESLSIVPCCFCIKACNHAISIMMGKCVMHTPFISLTAFSRIVFTCIANKINKKKRFLFFHKILKKAQDLFLYQFFFIEMKWKRAFYESERKRRDEKRQWDEVMSVLTYQREAIHLLETELKRARLEVRSLHRVTRTMHATLKEHNLQAHKVESVRICTAVDDMEMCPLSMAPINQSPAPFVGAQDAVDILKPNHKCAELGCGHRFNAVWLMRHFVSNRTFRCPVCRQGTRRFKFEATSIPRWLMLPPAENSTGDRS